MSYYRGQPPEEDRAITLTSSPETVLWGRLPGSGHRPVARICSGQRIVIDTVSHEGILEDQGRDPERFFGRHGVASDSIMPDAAAIAASSLRRDPGIDGPHIVTGPVEVAGVEPGDVIVVEVVALHRRTSYGIISNRHGRGALPGEMPATSQTVSTFARVEGGLGVIAAGARHIRFPLRPFLGLIGVTPTDAVPINSVPPGQHGGNLDISALGVGSRLLLRAQVAGGGVYVGDPHFSQGDGEVALTAFEAPLRAELRLSHIAAVDFDEATMAALPYGETAELLIPIGLHEDLDEAMRACVRSSLILLTRRFGIEAATAYAYLSAAADYAVSQVVDQVKGVHGKIRLADFAEFR